MIKNKIIIFALALTIFGLLIGFETTAQTPAATPTPPPAATPPPTASNPPPQEGRPLLPPPPVDPFRTVDLRKLKDISWPPADHDPAFKKKLMELGDLDKQKEMLKKACWDFIKKYQEHVQTSLKLGEGLAANDPFSVNCQIYALALDPIRSADSPLFDIPNPLLLARLDQVTLNLHTSMVTRAVVAAAAKAENVAAIQAVNKDNPLAKINEIMNESYTNSIFGILGVPREQNFMVTQVLCILGLLLAVVALVKHFI